jgi:hypothetical protein
VAFEPLDGGEPVSGEAAREEQPLVGTLAFPGEKEVIRRA